MKVKTKVNNELNNWGRVEQYNPEDIGISINAQNRNRIKAVLKPGSVKSLREITKLINTQATEVEGDWIFSKLADLRGDFYYKLPTDVEYGVATIAFFIPEFWLTEQIKSELERLHLKHYWFNGAVIELPTIFQKVNVNKDGSHDELYIVNPDQYKEINKSSKMDTFTNEMPEIWWQELSNQIKSQVGTAFRNLKTNIIPIQDGNNYYMYALTPFATPKISEGLPRDGKKVVYSHHPFIYGDKQSDKITSPSLNKLYEDRIKDNHESHKS